MFHKYQTRVWLFQEDIYIFFQVAFSPQNAFYNIDHKESGSNSFWNLFEGKEMHQCDQIWNIFESFWWYGFYKASPNAFLVIFWAKEKSNTFHGNLLWLLFGQLLVKFGLLFDSASGHCGNAWSYNIKHACASHQSSNGIERRSATQNLLKTDSAEQTRF